ncbi:hypothetical protein PG987_007335 [Apiospora arundinis]
MCWPCVDGGRRGRVPRVEVCGVVVGEGRVAGLGHGVPHLLEDGVPLLDVGLARPDAGPGLVLGPLVGEQVVQAVVVVGDPGHLVLDPVLEAAVVGLAELLLVVALGEDHQGQLQGAQVPDLPRRDAPLLEPRRVVQGLGPRRRHGGVLALEVLLQPRQVRLDGELGARRQRGAVRVARRLGQLAWQQLLDKAGHGVVLAGEGGPGVADVLDEGLLHGLDGRHEQGAGGQGRLEADLGAHVPDVVDGVVEEVVLLVVLLLVFISFSVTVFVFFLFSVVLLYLFFWCGGGSGMGLLLLGCGDTGRVTGAVQDRFTLGRRCASLAAAVVAGVLGFFSFVAAIVLNLSIHRHHGRRHHGLVRTHVALGRPVGPVVPEVLHEELGPVVAGALPERVGPGRVGQVTRDVVAAALEVLPCDARLLRVEEQGAEGVEQDVLRVLDQLAVVEVRIGLLLLPVGVGVGAERARLQRLELGPQSLEFGVA